MTMQLNAPTFSESAMHVTAVLSFGPNAEVGPNPERISRMVNSGRPETCFHPHV